MKELISLHSLPYFLYVAFELPYNSSYLSLYFSVRSRALASLVSALAQVFTTLLFGAFLDWTTLSLNRRARYGYIFMMALAGGCWIWGTIIQIEYTEAGPSLDWSDTGFGRGWYGISLVSPPFWPCSSVSWGNSFGFNHTVGPCNR